eukprot:271669-Pyramimonas_sp.AAC.1
MSQPGWHFRASRSLLLVANALVLFLLSGRLASSIFAQKARSTAASCWATMVQGPVAWHETSSTTLRILAMGAAKAAALRAEMRRSLANAVAHGQPATTVPFAMAASLKQVPMRALRGAR